TLKPLDEETILNSVGKTNRVLIVHEAWTTGGFGAEVASVIADKGFDWLDAPVKRLGAMDTPMSYNKELEHATIPSTDKIAETIRELMQYKEA
ncbi:MAG: transketolase C-terminal domain-containing protein, partial [Pseudomonadota bacterium]|nr:transketolase C-terminal domain-containing protein [Pseudomonadota bacterium]